MSTPDNHLIAPLTFAALQYNVARAFTPPEESAIRQYRQKVRRTDVARWAYSEYPVWVSAVPPEGTAADGSGLVGVLGVPLREYPQYRQKVRRTEAVRWEYSEYPCVSIRKVAAAPHLRRDCMKWAQPPRPAFSRAWMGSPQPHLHRDPALTM